MHVNKGIEFKNENDISFINLHFALSSFPFYFHTGLKDIKYTFQIASAKPTYNREDIKSNVYSLSLSHFYLILQAIKIEPRLHWKYDNQADY